MFRVFTKRSFDWARRGRRLAGWVAAALPVWTIAQPAPEPALSLPPFAVEERALANADLTRPPFALESSAQAGSSIMTLAEALRGAPGVLLQESFGGFEPPRVSIRGSGVQSAPSSRGVFFLLNGFPLNLADGSFNAALVDPQLVDRIDVYRGDAASLYAPAVLGGAFDLRTAPPAATGAAAHVEAGSYGAARATVRASASPRDFAIAGAGDFSRQDGWREHAAQERSAVLVTADRPSPAGSDSSLSVYHVRAAYDVPGPLTLAAAAAAPRSVSSDVRHDQPDRVSEATQVAVGTRQENPVLAFEAGAAWLHSTDFFQQLQSNGISRSTSDDLTLRAAITRRWDAGAFEHVLQVGAIALRGWRDVRRHLNDAGTAGREFGDDALQSTTAAGELEDTAQIAPGLAAGLGATFLAARRDIVDRMPAAPGVARTDQRWSASAVQPRGRLVWSPRRDLRFHASVSRADEPPTFDDLVVVSGTAPNLTRHSQSLATQRSTTWELGSSGSWRSVSWDVTAYHAEWSNEILRLADAHGQPRGAVNAGPTQHDGLETSAQWILVDGPHRLRLVATANWSRFVFENDPVLGRNRLAGTPPHLGSADLIYETPAGFFAATTLDWTAGATAADHAGRLTYGGYTIAGGRAGWRHGRSWTVFGQVGNLFDRRYIASTAGVLDVARNPAATAIFLPGTGRTVTLGFECTFH